MNKGDTARGGADDPVALGRETYGRIAHDLRNPLAPIRTAVQLLRMLQGDPARSKELLDLIERQVGHLVRLIDRLTEYGELHAGEIVDEEPADLALAVDEAIGNCSAVIGGAGHRLELALPEQGPMVCAEPRRLAQALTFVIENAAKFQASGGVIDVAVRSEDGYGVVRVRDRGFGMSPETLAGLYRPFTRGSAASPHAPNGLGLGLALARTILTAHGGTIEAASAGEGRGSEVTLRLPLAD